MIIVKKFKEYLKNELENFVFLNEIKKWGNKNDEIITGFFWKSFDDSSLHFDKIQDQFLAFVEKLDELLNFKKPEI